MFPVGSLSGGCLVDGLVFWAWNLSSSLEFVIGPGVGCEECVGVRFGCWICEALGAGVVQERVAGLVFLPPVGSTPDECLESSMVVELGLESGLVLVFCSP